MTTLPNTVTSPGSNTMSSSAGFAGRSVILPRLREVGLDRRLLAGDAGHDDVAVLGRRLLADHHVVAVEDAGLDHRVAADPQHEELPVAGEVLRQRHRLLDVLGREHAGTGGDVTDERHVHDRAAGPRPRRSRARSRPRSPAACVGSRRR